MKKAIKKPPNKKPSTSTSEYYRVRTDTGWKNVRLSKKGPNASRDYGLSTDSTHTVNFSYKTIHELLIKDEGFSLLLSEPVKERGLAAFLLFPKDRGLGGVEIKISSDVISVLCSALEIHTPGGVQGIIDMFGESCIKHFLQGLITFKFNPHQSTLPKCSESCQKNELKKLLENMLRTALINSAPKIKDVIRDTAPNINKRKVRGMIEFLNAVSRGEVLPERKKKRGRPTKAEAKAQKITRVAKSQKLFGRYKKKDDTE
jgi:hypothetical protein